MKSRPILLLLLLTVVLQVENTFAQFTGNYNIGTGQTYTTLKSFCDAVNAGSVTGNITVYITSDLTESTNFGLGINTNGYSITIRPDQDVNRTITFTSTTDNTGPSGHFVIGNPTPTATWTDANTIATSNITVDGYATGYTTRRLKFTNSSANTANARLITVVGACENTVIKNCIFENNSTSATSPVCLVAVVRKGTAIDVAPINLTIENNTLTGTASNVSMGMRLTNSNTPTTKITGFVFKNNSVTAKRRLLEINYTDGGDIYNNEFTTPANGAAGTVTYGIWTSTGLAGTFNIYNNKFLQSTTQETGAYGHRVISLASTATYNIYNNTFSGMNKTSASSAALNLVYLFYSGVAGKIYNNTFYMPALTDATHSGGYYACIQLTGNTAEIKNNNFISDEATHTNPYFISAVPTPASDYNNFYMRQSNANHKVVSSYTSLSAYQSANPTKDVNSINSNVTFSSATDLHINTGTGYDAIPAVSMKGTPITGYTTDIDGDTRHSTKPDIGADEFQISRTLTTTGSLPASDDYNNITVNGSSITASLGGNVAMTGTLTLTSGLLSLGSNNLTLGASSAISGTPSASKMIVAEGTGELRKTFTGTGSFTFPVGDNTGTAEYSPATLNFTSGSFSSAYAAVRLANAKHGNNSASSHYLNRYWKVTQSGITSFSCNATFTYADGDIVGTEGSIYGGKNDGGATWTGLGLVDAGNNRITANALSSFSDFSGMELEALPVELATFRAYPDRRNVTLDWQTATEVNSSKFVIERSEDGQNWLRVGDVQASGYSNAPRDYTFTDKSRLGIGKYFYRLKMIDTDGTFEYSKVVEAEVGVPAEFALSQNYPNPFNPTTKIDYQVPVGAYVNISLFSVTGEKVAELVGQYVDAGYYTLNLDANKLRLGSGVYLFRMAAKGDGGESFGKTLKLILTK